MTDWSTEISNIPAAPTHGGATASTTTTTTTTTSASASHGGMPNNPAAPQNMTMTVTSAAPQSMPSTPAVQTRPLPAAPFRNEFDGSIGTLDLESHQPIEVVEAPATVSEAFLGSMKSMLHRNRGNFVAATFLIGTQGTTIWEGILHDVGNDYLIIFQPGRQRYIACDIYSLKYIEFYDTRQQEVCERLLRENEIKNPI